MTDFQDCNNLGKRFREQYDYAEFNEEDAHSDPFYQFKEWFFQNEVKSLTPNAMTLSTLSKDLQVHSRIVLLNAFSPDGFIFYSNYESQKGQDLTIYEKASLQFFFEKQQRVVRLQGAVVKSSREDSLAYFRSRPKDSQLAAYVSQQSRKVSSRKKMMSLYDDAKRQFKDRDVPLPDYWGGYCFKPHYFEFWQGRPNRFHDRLVYVLENKVWKITRLFP